MSVVMISATGNHMVVNHTGFVNKDTTADFKIELALWDRGHATTSNAIRVGRYLYPMAHTGYGLIDVEEVASYPNEILVVSDVFRIPENMIPRYSSSTTSENARFASIE